MSVSNKTNYNKSTEYWKIKIIIIIIIIIIIKPVSRHTYSTLFVTIFNAILFKKLT